METDELLPEVQSENAGDDERDPLLSATLQLEQAAHYLDLEHWILHRLRQSEREVALNLQVVRAGGEPANFSGFRVEHRSGGMPALGPLWIARDADLHSIRAAAMEATWQLALLELPFGGAAGAVRCEPAEMGESELRELIKEYAAGLRGFTGPFRDILAPGPGCNEQIMAWMTMAATTMTMARMRPQINSRALAAVAGKPVALWGVPGYYDAVAMAAVSLLRLAIGEDAIGGSLRGRRVSMQGFGTFGRPVARLLALMGVEVVAAADSSGGIQNCLGLDMAALGKHLEHEGMLFGFSAADAISNHDVLETKCDALVLGAGERQITADNASRIRSRIVVEAVQGAVTEGAEAQLSARGIKVIPWLMTGAASLIAAHLEWAQNTQPALIPRALNAEIDLRMKRLHSNVMLAASEYSTSCARAALLLAVDRVAKQMRLCGP